ncbi:PREDICTED: protein RADIALIS-like 4 [Nelumbo nucifera]|uniref:Uncharacterized protein n=2 Tax=Nelumbo nucifera TaxID=4432 RepID=A0A822Z4K7_NELNU|nr:PREDICTED: protein RADIALIS-like 4 [Nelumbo nucifera]DAD38415.1 TPA_asm: hypothetical protein HUJ06_009056 [Nelumbo nucifera]
MASVGGWSREEEKAFETAIAMHWATDDSKDRWEKIASMVPSKTVDELKKHYKVLVEDVDAIESGQIPIPTYVKEEAANSKDQHLFPAFASRAADKRLNCNFGIGFSGLGTDSGEVGIRLNSGGVK